MSDLTDKMIAAGIDAIDRSDDEDCVRRVLAAALRVLDDQQLYLCDASHDDVMIVLCDTLADEIEASS